MIGRMDLTRWRETSYNGVSMRALKSGLQKYARRGMLQKGLDCLVELDLVQLLESDPDAIAAYLRRQGQPSEAEGEAAARRRVVQRARALRTNLVNRLIVITSEDVGIACWWLPLVVDDRYRTWQACRELPAARKHLLDLYTSIATRKKLRLVSDLKSVYLLPPDYVSPAERGALRREHADLCRSLGLENLLADRDAVPEQLIDACSAEIRLALAAHDPEVRRIVNGVLYQLKQRGDNVFYWVNRLIERQRDARGEPRLGTRADLCNLVWRLLLDFADQHEALWGGVPEPYPANAGRLREIIVVLKRWYDEMTHRERPIYLYHALLLVVRRGEIDWSAAIPVVDTPWQEVEQRYRAALAGRSIELDPYVFDIHTGRRAEHALTQFASEGAFVENEDRTLRNDDYRRIYQGLKERLDSRRSARSGGRAASGGAA